MAHASDWTPCTRYKVKRQFDPIAGAGFEIARMHARLLIGLAVATSLLAGCYGRHQKFRSADVTGADWGKSLALTGHDGKARTLADFNGKLIVLTFGYTNCSQICRTTLADMAQVVGAMKAKADRVQVLFVTLDPARDTPKPLAKYVSTFHPRFLGLYGNAAATERAAKEFKVVYSARNGYAAEHSAQSYVFDTEGRLRLVIKPERIGPDLAHDLEELMREARKGGRKT